MKRIAIFISAILILVLASCSLNLNQSVDLGDQGEIVNGVIYGKVNGFEILENRLIIGYNDRSAVDKIVERLGGEVYLELPKINAVAIRIPMKVEEAINILKASRWEGIRYVEPSYRRYIIDPEPGVVGQAPALTRSEDGEEEFWSQLWGLQKINAKAAWDAGYTGEGVVVAVVDTPIDGQHPDLIGQFVTGYDPGDTNHASALIPPDTDYEDPDNPEDDHGTHVAGTIAAKRDGQGVVGLAYGAKIMPILIFRGYQKDDGTYSYYYIGDEFVADGIIWAVDHGADVLSNSWGGGGYSYTLKAAIDYALSHGAVFVAAAGNGHTDQHWHYPSAYPGVIAVAASTARDEVVGFSNRGDYISVAAPGVNILSTVPHLAGYGVYGKPYDFWGGTSMATPHVSALAAILKQKYPNATPYQIKKMIEESAVDIEDPGWDHSAGYGRIDVEGALSKNPDDYAGAIYHVKVVSKDGGWGIPAALVTLKRKSGDGGDYFAATDENGVASFYYIDPDQYDVIIGGPDLYEINSPILRMEEQTGTQYSTTLTAGEATDTATFDTTVLFQFDVAPSDTAYMISAGYYYNYDGSIYPIWEFTNETGESTEVLTGISAGQVIAMYSIPDPAESTVTIYATAIVNGYVIPIYGEIGIGATYTFLDESTKNTLPRWWTAF